MKITLISAGDPLPEWGGAQIQGKTFGLPADIEQILSMTFPYMKPLEFDSDVNPNKLPELRCNACNSVGLPHIKTL